MSNRHRFPLLALVATLLLLTLLAGSKALGDNDWLAHLPLLTRPEPEPQPLIELRGLWVTRFDWTSYGSPADPAKIDEIVNNAAAAGFNAIFFQVRGAGDAYYTPGLEPWAQRVSGGTLGQPPDPLWDPLAYFVTAAHTHNLQLHAYLNVYPVWDQCTSPPPPTTPPHVYALLEAAHGSSSGQLNGLQWDSDGLVSCAGYLRATPASLPFADHFVAVAADLVQRYDIDGLHLDHIRYAAPNTSCDPVSAAAFGGDCFSSPAYADWQRAQINQLVARLYTELLPQKPGLWLSAAVWPIYQDVWGWGGSQGYSDYYQDSQAWLQGGYIDSLMPMIYPSVYNCPYSGFWTLERWGILAADFQASSAGRFVIPGIGTGYCTFDEIAARIDLARAAGTAGHALFSYGGLLAGDGVDSYFDDLANGPYALPAGIPTITWHP